MPATWPTVKIGRVRSSYGSVMRSARDLRLRRRAGDLDPARLGLLRERQGDGEDAVGVVGRDALGIDPVGDAQASADRTVEPLLGEHVVGLAVAGASLRADRQDVVLDGEVDL